MADKKTTLALVYVLFAALFASGCNRRIEQFTATPRPAMAGATSTLVQKAKPPTSTSPPPLPSATPTLNPLPPVAPSPTLASLPTKMPDILLNLGTNDWFWQSCFPEEGTAQIWFSKYPYSEFQPLLDDDGVDYLYPRWAPSGSQFAYVESIPIIVPEGAEIPATVDKGVSVWVQDQSGNRRRVSDILPRINFLQADSCGPATYVFSPPLWSPDERKIVFTYADLFKFEINYYLIDLDAGTTRLFYKDTIKGGAYENPIWISPNQIVLLSEKNILHVFDEEGEERQRIEPPEDLLATTHQPIIYTLQIFEHKLLVGFAETKTVQRNPVALYLVDIASGTWEPVLDTSAMNITRIFSAASQSVACGKTLTIFNKQWQMVGQSNEIPVSPECKNFKLFEYQKRIFASDAASTEKNDGHGIWVMVIQERAPQPELLIDLSELPEAARRLYYIVIDYSWRISGH